jgi:uncharacterized protein (TIGR02996 family)
MAIEMYLEPAFINAVLAAPNDDLPRLIAADWLDEHGQPEWAALIRVQCERAHIHSCDHWIKRRHCRSCLLKGREADVLAACGWSRESCTVRLNGQRFVVKAFDRGFIRRVVMDDLTWLHTYDTAVPPIPFREVSLWNVFGTWGRDDGAKLARHAPTSRLHTLDISSGVLCRGFVSQGYWTFRQLKRFEVKWPVKQHPIEGGYDTEYERDIVRELNSLRRLGISLNIPDRVFNRYVDAELEAALAAMARSQDDHVE